LTQAALSRALGSIRFESFEGRGEEISNLKCLVQLLEGGERRGANFIALPKLSLN